MREMSQADRAAVASIREVAKSFRTVIEMRLKEGPKKAEVLDYVEIICDTCESAIRAQGAPEIRAESRAPVPGACV